MFIACQEGHLNIVQLLFQNGAKDDVRRPNKKKQTPMFTACRNGHLSIVQFLLKHGAEDDVRQPTAINASTSMSQIFSKNRLNIIQWFIQKDILTPNDICKKDIKKLNADSRKQLHHESIESRSDHENILTLMLFLHQKNIARVSTPSCIQKSCPPVFQLHRFHRHSTVLQSIVEFVQGTSQRRTLRFHILQMLEEVVKEENELAAAVIQAEAEVKEENELAAAVIQAEAGRNTESTGFAAFIATLSAFIAIGYMRRSGS